MPDWIPHLKNAQELGPSDWFGIPEKNTPEGEEQCLDGPYVYVYQEPPSYMVKAVHIPTGRECAIDFEHQVVPLRRTYECETPIKDWGISG